MKQIGLVGASCVLFGIAMIAVSLVAASSENAQFSIGDRVGNALSWGIALGDADGDGDLDALVANESRGSLLWMNDGCASFIENAQPFPDAIAGKLVDVDGDEDLEIMLVMWDEPLSVWRGEGDGTYSEVLQGLLPVGAIDLAAADLDADGDLDLFLARDGEDIVLINDGTGMFSDSGQRLGTGFSAEVELSDMDQDGDIDAVADGWGGSGHIWLNDGSGFFTQSHPLTGPNWHVNGLALGDVDGDGDLDAVLVSSLYDPHEIWLNDGSARLVDSGQRLAAPDGYGVALGDVDGDDDLDMVMVIGGQPRTGIALWINEDGVFVQGQIEPYAALGRDVALADLDDDGDLDIFGAFLAYTGRFLPSPNRIWLNRSND